MANNRLYIIDTKTGDEFMLVKSFGIGWHTRMQNDGEACMCERLNDWLDGRDASSFGYTHEPTELRIVTENSRMDE